MTKIAKVLTRCRALTLLAFFVVPHARARDAEPPPSPDAALKAFYHNYLTLINDSKDPLRKDRDFMKRYVESDLVEKLIKHTETDEDYFTKSQDILDDWVDHITATDGKCSLTECRMHVVLGLSKDPVYKIDVDLKNSPGGWRISRVTKPKA